MKVKTSDLIGPALDWAVAKCEKQTPSKTTGEPFLYEHRVYLQDFCPSTYWVFGGPIIERENITLRTNARIKGHWIAFIDFGSSYCNVSARQSAPTPLIAAMRCYVVYKLGDEVEIPDDLI